MHKITTEFTIFVFIIKNSQWSQNPLMTDRRHVICQDHFFA